MAHQVTFGECPKCGRDTLKQMDLCYKCINCGFLMNENGQDLEEVIVIDPERLKRVADKKVCSNCGCSLVLEVSHYENSYLADPPNISSYGNRLYECNACRHKWWEEIPWTEVKGAGDWLTIFFSLPFFIIYEVLKFVGIIDKKRRYVRVAKPITIFFYLALIIYIALRLVKVTTGNWFGII